LAAAIRDAAKEDATRQLSAQPSYSPFQSGSILRGRCRVWRSVRARLAEGKIDPQDGDAGGSESAGKRYQERRARIRPSTMRQYQAIRGGAVDPVQVTTNSW